MSAFSIYIPLGKEKRKDDAEENFIPSKASDRMQVISKEKVLEGYDIFNTNPGQVPSREQLKQIWFTFNMTRNFIGNRNLYHDGDPQKFIRWMSVLQKNYPLNADMPFFLSLAYQLTGNASKAEEYYQITQDNLDGYWARRFSQFGLLDIFNQFPKNPNAARKTIISLKESTLEKIC